MSIKTNFFRIKKLILTSPTAKEDLMRKATPAIRDGIGSSAWVDLMSVFAETPEQLSRLSGTDATYHDREMDQGRAYLASNSFFGLENNSYWMLDSLDSGLPNSDDSIQRWEEPSEILIIHLDTFDDYMGTFTLKGEKLTASQSYKEL